ncbi:glycosyltransferase family 2 protein [Bacillus sp. V59.32b]|uniref:glycosyltransferase family 2 protein n=1 Tax=Bacillus sp. V59.32b TaxID=1758642 RepID=UPI000E3CD459|nr:glycosyltransferase family 2 protein [Bacillus sp. V59.32b]RFU66838.1 glycosyltransferase [Bacillus sp. V59.32b]
MTEPRIAVLLPCYNEEITIGKVIDDFKRVLPQATIYVYDNNSKDRTSEIAREHGAVVKFEPRQGKGNVVRSMFNDIDADYYIMADGDDTYPAEFAPKLLAPLVAQEANLVIGDRLSNGTYTEENKRNFHNFGNVLVRKLINWLYKSDINDIMTGYRAFDRYFVKTMPVLSPGFEIETEMSIHALENRFLIKEIEIDYRDRPIGSESKLNTFSDGYKVIMTILKLCKNTKPLFFFGILASIFCVLGLASGIPVVFDYLKTGLVERMPTAILATGLMLLSMMFFMCGLILDTIAHKHKQLYMLELIKIKKLI